jgi:hypothetical protein
MIRSEAEAFILGGEVGFGNALKVLFLCEQPNRGRQHG